MVSQRWSSQSDLRELEGAASKGLSHDVASGQELVDTRGESFPGQGGS